MSTEKKVLPILEWEPTDDRILVQRFENEKISKGGIIIPDTAQEKAYKGVVIDIGECINLDDSNNYQSRKGKKVKVGDIVLFGKYSGSEIDVIIENKTEEVLVMRVADVIAVRKTNYWNEPSQY